jgi:hypothetical protein
MRKFILLAALLAVLVAAALPAFADKDRNDGKNRQNHGHNGGGGGPAISQESEQEAESGNLDQSFNVTGGGDNSNQCVGIQGVGNTGNAQNQIDLIQYGSEANEFEFDEVNSSIEMNPTNTTECDQQVNQAASASGGGGTPVRKY